MKGREEGGGEEGEMVSLAPPPSFLPSLFCSLFVLRTQTDSTHDILPRSLLRYKALIRHRQQRLYSSFVVVSVSLEDLLQYALFDSGEHRLQGSDLGIRRGWSNGGGGRIEVGHRSRMGGMAREKEEVIVGGLSEARTRGESEQCLETSPFFFDRRRGQKL